MKRLIKLSDGIILIIGFTIGSAIFANFSETFTANDVMQSAFFVLVNFIAIFLLLGEKVRGGE